MRTLAHLSLTFALAAMMACGGAGKKEGDGIEQDPIEFEDPPDKPNADGDKPTKPAHLTVVAVTIKADGQVITINADGLIEGGGKQIGTITKAGEYLAANGGLLGTVLPDGSMASAFVDYSALKGIVISEGGVLQKKASETGEMVDLNAISETGEVSEGGNVRFVIEGPAEGRKAAMFVYMTLVFQARAAQGGATKDANATPEGESKQ